MRDAFFPDWPAKEAAEGAAPGKAQLLAQMLLSQERMRVLLPQLREVACDVPGVNLASADEVRSPVQREMARAAGGADGGNGEGSAPGEGSLVRGDLVLDSDRHLCTWKGGEVQLTVTEFLLIQSLAQRPGHVKTRDQLMDAAYGESIYVDDRTIDSHIKRLRAKFRQADNEFAQIETLYGVGYRYRDS